MSVVEDVCDRVVIINKGKIVADDAVENLKALFRYRRYRIDVRGRLDGSLHKRLEADFEGVAVESDSEFTHIEADIPDAESFYLLFDVLHKGGAVVESINRQEPDFEQVYLRIVRGSEKDGGGSSV